MATMATVSLLEIKNDEINRKLHKVLQTNFNLKTIELFILKYRRVINAQNIDTMLGHYYIDLLIYNKFSSDIHSLWLTIFDHLYIDPLDEFNFMRE